MMAHTSFAELIRSAGAAFHHGDADISISDVQYDSRQVKPGDLFVALRGGYADGHAFLEDARRRGAVAALVEEPSGAKDFTAVAVAGNTREALAPLSARFFDYPGEHLGVIGITGTDGKTTTSYMIDAMLRHNGLITGLVGTIAIRVGTDVLEHDTRQTTPESLEVQRLLARMRDAHVDWAVLEATSHALALYRLNECPFDIGVITNVTREHLDFHGTVEAYREAKAQLLRKIESRSDRPFPRVAVVNRDDEGARQLGDGTSLPVTWFSTRDQSAEIFARNIDVHEQGTSFDITLHGESSRVNLQQIGSYNVLNAMAAAGAGDAIGLDLPAIRGGLEALPFVPGRMQRVVRGQPFNVIVDYAHSPASLEETLRLARSVTSGRLLVVSGSAGERDRGKRPVQGRICADLADYAVFTSEDPRFEDPHLIIQEIADGAVSAGALRGKDFEMIEDRRTAIDHVISRACPGDTVLLAGKGHETCIIYEDQRVPWNEADVAEELLAMQGYDQNVQNAEGQT